MGQPWWVVSAALVLVIGTTAGCTVQASLKKRVGGNLVFWDQSRGFEAIAANLDLFTEISPFWYRVLPDGRVVPYTTASGATYEDPSMVSFLKGKGILVIPTVANIVDGQWDGASVSRIINNQALRDVNVGALVQLAVSRGYDGIDLDYEDLPASDRTAFTAFVRQLGDDLHARGKLLTVNVYAKTSEPGTWAGPQSQDWSAIAAAADQVRIMAYEYHWATSDPGPVAPIGWVREVLEFARSRIPAEKIIHGLPLYGYDWVGQSGVDHVWESTMALAQTHGATVNWDAASASPWFQYTAGGSRHTVWFENGASTEAKLEAAGTSDVGGVTLWRLGGQDPATWSALRARFGAGSPPADSTPPVVNLISPTHGAMLASKQTVEARASDSSGIARVEFFVDGLLVGRDTVAPYAVVWNSRPASRGAHVITAVAYDVTGNSAWASVTAYR